MRGKEKKSAIFPFDIYNVTEIYSHCVLVLNFVGVVYIINVRYNINPKFISLAKYEF